nr:type VI secretion system Vgr family protein [Paraburkholderia diazotrophica]
MGAGTGRQAYFLDVPGIEGAGALSVVSFEATERLGEPYRITLRLTHPDALSRADYLGRNATLSIVTEHAQRRTFAGWITRFARLKTTRDFTSYELAVEAHVAKLAHIRTSRIYQHVTAPEIIEQVLRRHGFRGHQYSFRLRRQYPQHAFRLQYQMDDLAWVQLLMRQEGIYSYFTSGEHGDIVNLCDDIDHYVYQPALDVPYREQAGLESGVEAVTSLATVASTVAQSVAVADYNPSSAWERFRDEANIATDDSTTYGQFYVWGAHHLDAQGAKWEAQLRHEAAIASQIVYEGQSNVLALAPARILHIDEILPDAPHGQVIVEVTHRGARDDAYTNSYKAIPSDRRFRLPLNEETWPKIGGTLSARITSPGKYKYAYVTQQGHYVVRFDLDFDEWSAGGESVPLRLAKPFAGALQTGFHFPLLDGTEVAVAFHDGDPNRPYIAHAMHNSQAIDHITSDDRWLSRNVIRTQSNNKFRMEDWEGQEGIKLSTEHAGKTQLNLGYLVDSKKQKRGEGFELRTSGSGVLRGGSGLHLTAYDRPGASGQQLDMQETIAQLEQALALAHALAESAKASKAEPADTDAQKAINDDFNQLKQPGLLASAPASIAIVAAKGVQIAASHSIQTIAGKDADFSIMKRFTIAAGELISLFAHTLGVKIFAARGPVRIQAQSDTLAATAMKDLTVTSTAGRVVLSAKDEVWIGAGGSYISITATGIRQVTPGDYIEKAASWQKQSPDAAMKKAALPWTTDLPDTGQHGSRFSG